ncbi:MAG TPA: hypothetical protein VJA87_04005 [Candidatus Paceibacterota bacterium]
MARPEGWPARAEPVPQGTGIMVWRFGENGCVSLEEFAEASRRLFPDTPDSDLWVGISFGDVAVIKGK